MNEITELAKNYEEEAKRLEAQLNRLKDRRRKIPPDDSRYATLSHDICVVEDMLFEQRVIARTLKEYYNNDTR